MKKLTAIITLIVLGIIFLGATLESTFFTNASLKTEASYFNSSDKSVQKEFNVKQGGKLILELKNGGSINIEGWQKDVVKVDAVIKGRDADDIKIEFDQNGNELNITSYYAGDRKNNSSNTKISLMVPNNFNVDFNTMGGGVTINKVSGELEGKTMGGELNLSNLKGNVNMTTMGGKITVSDCEVNGKVKTMGGQVLVENVTGDLDASSMGGKVIQRNVKGNKNSVGKEVNISTMGGEIDVDSAPNGANVKTMGGDITINSAAKFVKAETYGGDIEIKEVDGSVEAKTFGGDVDVNVVGIGNDKEIDLSSLGGDITLNIPSNFSMDVFVEIAYTKEWSRKHKSIEEAKVEGDFKFSEDRSSEWENSKGSPRKYLRAKGSFNGGKNKVVVKTINGNVTIKKS